MKDFNKLFIKINGLIQIAFGIFTLVKLAMSFNVIENKIFILVFLLIGSYLITSGFTVLKMTKEGKIYAVTNVLCGLIISLTGILVSGEIVRSCLSYWGLLLVVSLFYLIFFFRKDVKEIFG